MCAFSVPPVFRSASGFMYPVLVLTSGGRGTSCGGTSLGWNVGARAFILGLGFLISGSPLLWTSVFLSLEQTVFVMSC